MSKFRRRLEYELIKSGRRAESFWVTPKCLLYVVLSAYLDGENIFGDVTTAFVLFSPFVWVAAAIRPVLAGTLSIGMNTGGSLREEITSVASIDMLRL